MASSFRIKLKVPPNNNNNSNNGAGSPKKAQQSSTSNNNAYTPSPPRSSPALGGGGGGGGGGGDSSVMGMDDNSSVFSDAVGGGSAAAVQGEEEELDELEDSPPPPQRSSPSKPSTGTSGNRVASYGQPTGKVRKLSGAAAMKAANSLKRANITTAATGTPGSSSVTGSPGGVAAGSTSVDVSKSPSPAVSESRASQSLSPGLSPSNSATGSTKRRQILASLGRPIEEMSLAEIEALPAAKRRKGLKARGAAGPGRGWRKGLKMDQKPVYRQPGESPPATVAPSTPSSFGVSSKPKSALGRDAYSKTGTPTRQSSPAEDADNLSASGGGDSTSTPATSTSAARTFSASHAAVAARKARAKGDDLATSGQAATTNTAAASSSTDAASPPRAAPLVKAPAVNSQAEEGRLIKAIMRGGPSVLPPPRIPVGFVTTVPLDKSRRAVRKWQKRDREILSLGGRVWGALTWITSSSSPTDGETQATGSKVQSARPMVTETATPIGVSRAASPSATAQTTVASERGNSTSTTAAATVSPSTSTQKGHPSTASAKMRTPLEGSPVPAMTKSNSSSSDWRGSSAAFTAANRGRN